MSALLQNFPLLADWATGVWGDINSNNQFVLLVVAIGCATGVLCTLIAIASGTINSIHRRQIEAGMKRDMLDRGMSAEEIVKVIEAAMPPEDATQRWIASWAKQKNA